MVKNIKQISLSLAGTFLCYIISLHLLYADEIAGNFVCNVKSTFVTKMENGISQRYSGFIDGLDAGHTLFLSYWYGLNKKGESVFSIDSESEDVTNFTGISTSDEFFEVDSFGLSSENLKIFLSSNYLRAISLNGNIVLKKYGNRKWNGTYTSYLGAATLVAGLDCRLAVNSYEKMLNRLQSDLMK